MPRPRPWAALTITHGHLSPRATSSPYSVDPAARRAVVNPAITGDLGAKARPAHRQGNGPGRSKPGTSGAMAKAPNVHARASPPPPRRPRLPARPARYAFLLTTFVTQRDAICRVTCCRPIESVGHHRSGGRRRVMWPPMLRSNGPVQLPAGLLRADRRFAADSLLGRVGGGLRAPAGTSAIVRHRQPFRCAELAAVIRRGELHDGPGVAGRGPGVRGAVSGQLAWEGGADQRAARLSTFPQPRSSTPVQRGGQRIYRNHPQAYTQGVTLAG